MSRIEVRLPDIGDIKLPHLFAIGDLAGDPRLAHEAVHEAHEAAELAQGSCTDVPPQRKR
ncbi:MAG TPA: hypothetical protein PKJ45_02185 [Rubrivivax sp.]|nr:hypothetical protein [Rubrivivax sp.]